MIEESPVSAIAHVIQLAVAPVFLLTGVDGVEAAGIGWLDLVRPDGRP